jgi:hypothetical protein
LPFCQLLDPICLLTLSISNRDVKVWYPGVVIDDEPFRAFTDWEGDHVSVGVELSFEVTYLVSEAKVAQGVLFFPLLNSGGEALGNVEDSGRVVLVELHHMLGGAGGEGSCRSCGGPYSGRRANGHLDQSINGDS